MQTPTRIKLDPKSYLPMSLSATGWGISLLIHIVAAVIFFTVSPTFSTSIKPNKPRQAILETHDKSLPDEPLITNLKIEPMSRSLLEPVADAANPPALPQDPQFPKRQFTAITALTGPTGADGFGQTNVMVTQPLASSFCGTTGAADRICFVVDCSGSMVIAFDYVRRELKRAINSLGPAQYFHIIFFAGGEPIEMPQKKLVRAHAPNRRRAIPFIDRTDLTDVPTMQAAWQALAQALQTAFKVKAFDSRSTQLIYLFTDGEFDHQQINRTLIALQSRRDKPVTINVIACGNTDNEIFLRNQAQRYQGQYRFISDEELARRP